MNKIRIVVADDSELTRKLIVDYLSEEDDIEVVGTVTDGEEAITVIKDTMPDMVILDLVMPKVDGLGVMEEISQSENYGDCKPEYIVISAAGSEGIVSEAIRMGASYFIMKPFNGEALVKRIKQIAARTVGQPMPSVRAVSAENTKPTTYMLAVRLLRNLGVSVRMTGYKYIRDAIILAVNDSDSLASITKTIYPEIAEAHQTSSGNVERNIRYVIEVTWAGRRDPKYAALFEEIFGTDDVKPTNSRFILSCSEWINSSIQE
ncbi:MAG: sporulation transcription factor Spo0A [Butyrivibrio sp.]|nr:sporulation transcription factor Spo0A [Butyrivibrio sp.]